MAWLVGPSKGLFPDRRPEAFPVPPEAQITLTGVEEGRCLIHAPNESVDPTEIEHMAIAEALFLAGYAAGR